MEWDKLTRSRNFAITHRILAISQLHFCQRFTCFTIIKKNCWKNPYFPVISEIYIVNAKFGLSLLSEN